MGILNATPDSFYAPSRTMNGSFGDEEIDRLISQKPDIIDIGGESSRPGSLYISSAEEINRVLPVLKAIRKKCDIPVSIDTRKSEVAKVCLNEGANIVNDISALEDDADMAALIAVTGSYVILMHKQGTPVTMQDNPSYNDTVSEVKRYLEERTDFAVAAGIPKNKIIIDPGFGFGKSLSDNLRLLAELEALRIHGVKLLVGISRKSMIGDVLGVGADDRLAGTITVNTFAALHGADIIRVHDITEHMHMKKMIQAIIAAGVDNGAS